VTLLADLLTGAADAPFGISERGPDLLPLDAGEQYRFSFDMGACIGCHSCEVACAEQNGNPVGVNWRRVGEVEGGSFPDTRRFNLSMACNHCLEPTCLSGCPTNAYEKLANGIVTHNAEECIGCQYCIWNCPYEVPVFNPDRGVVTKCDLCLPRLETGGSPACVDACPTRAITVEKVNVAQWREDHSGADGPGLPSAEITLSTTRVVLPDDLPAGTRPANDDRAEPADPHWPLVFLTLLTQLALGTVAATVTLEALAGAGSSPGPVDTGALAGGAVAAFSAGAVALLASLLHLGRPSDAWKALRNLRRSWLSREVALFSLFAGASMAYAGAWWANGDTSVPVAAVGVGAVATVLGAVGVYASGRLYLVPARPVWNSRRTLVAFFATAVATGPLLALLSVDRTALTSWWGRLLLLAAAAGNVAQLGVVKHLAMSIATRREREFQATARLLRVRFQRLYSLRVIAAIGAAAMCAWGAGAPIGGPVAASRIVVAFALACAGEFAGRYLFFVTVTPMTAARSYSSPTSSRGAKK